MIINIKAITNAKKDEIIPLDNNTFKIKVTDLPVDNKANKKIIKILLQYFSVSKSQVVLKKGHKSSNKIIEIHT